MKKVETKVEFRGRVKRACPYMKNKVKRVSYNKDDFVARCSDREQLLREHGGTPAESGSS